MHARPAIGIALSALTALALLGCTPEQPTETTPPPTPATAEPTMSDSDVMAAARQAWDAYETRLSELGEEPSSATREPLLEVATPEFTDFLLQNFQDAANRHIHTEGPRSTTAFEALDLSDSPGRVVVSLCQDLSQERLMGDEGIDLTPPEQAEPRSRTVVLTRSGDDQPFLIDSVSDFDGAQEQDPCR